MDAATRRWWVLMDRLPAMLGRITVWSDAHAWPPTGSGSMHANPTSVICLEGVVRVTRPGRSLDLLPGETLLIAPGIWHQHPAPRRGSVAFGQGFMPAWSDVLIRDHERNWSGKLPLQPSRSLMEEALLAADPDARRTLVARMIRQVLDESVTDLVWGQPALKRMMRCLWSRLHLGVTPEDLVRASGLGRSQAYVLFTKGYGVTPKAAIAVNRLWLATSLLRSGLPIAEVAARSGYPSAGTFTRCWRRAHGSPPSSGIAPAAVRPRRRAPG